MQPQKKEWGHWHTDGNEVDESNKELMEQARTVFDKWGNYASEARAGRPPEHSLATILLEATELKDKAMHEEKKLKRKSWNDYVEEALSSKVRNGYQLTRLREMEDVPKAAEKNGFSTGIKDILKSEVL